MLETQLKIKREEVDLFLDNNIPKREKPAIIYEAMRYSLLAGGKRIRPIISLMISEMLGGDKNKVLFPACAIELIHTYSLIHDDLPALDNDDFRRGKASNHKKFGEAIAILAGDALLTLAFQWIAQTDHHSDVIVKMLNHVSVAAGTCGMIGGQVADLQSEGNIHWKNRSPEEEASKEIKAKYAGELEYIHLHKTAALIRASVMIGALAAETDNNELEKCFEFGTLLGLAFQVADDILDVEGEQKTLGKSIGKDAESNKLTYPALYGLKRSKDVAKELIEKSKDIIAYFNNSELLIKLAEMIIQRKK